MPGIDGYEVCRRAARRPGDGVPARRDDHRQRRAGEAARDRGRRRRLRHEAVRPGRAARARALAAADQALPRRDRGVQPRAASFLPPQVAELVKGDPSVLESHRREIAVLACALHGFAAFAESAEPEDVMAVLGAYHAALGRAGLRGGGDAGAADRATGCWSCSTTRWRAPTRRRCAVRLALAMRDRVWELAEELGARAASRCSSRAGSRSGTRRSGGSASSGAGSTRRSGRRRCSPSGCASALGAGRSWSRSGWPRPWRPR